MFEFPYLIGAAGILYGYLSAMLKSENRHDDSDYLKFFRRYEFQSLLNGKNKNLIQHNSQIRELAKKNNDPRLTTSPPSR
jgi:hemin uptake protein HemP